MEKCYTRGYDSGHQIGTLLIKPSEYVQGHGDYSEKAIYRKGDLKKALASDRELLHKVIEMSQSNAQKCPARSSTSFGRTDWNAATRNLKDEIGRDWYLKLSKPVKQAKNKDVQGLFDFPFDQKAPLGKPLHCLQLLSLVSSCSVEESRSQCNPLTGKGFNRRDKTGNDRVLINAESWMSSRRARTDDFILKNQEEGFLYLFTKDGVHKVLLKDEDYFKPGEQPTDKIYREGYYQFNIGKKTYNFFYRKSFYSSSDHREEEYMLEPSEDTARIKERCAKQEDKLVCNTATTVQLPPDEANKLISAVATHQLENAVKSREAGSEDDHAPDCSIWEEVQKSCDQKQLDGRSKELVAWNLGKAHQAGVANYNRLCSKGKDYLKKAAGIAPPAAGEAR
jgi:hypothetical protein